VDRAEKRKVVDALRSDLSEAGVIVVAHYKGLSVPDVERLRREIRNAGASVRVAKNRLVKIAATDMTYESLSSLMRGPTLLAYSSDPVAAPKIVVEFAKKHEQMAILGGVIGSSLLSEQGVRSLASLPSLDVLRATLVGLLSEPAERLVRLMQTPSENVVGILSAYAAQTEEVTA
jgi:large subunit ribosomal protein L10